MRLSIFTSLFLACCSLFAQTDKLAFTESVYFASASPDLSREAKAQIADFTANLSGYADFTLRLEAFTDEQGATDYNEQLAADRAASVKAFLEATGISTDSWSIATHGERLAKTNTTDDDERKTDRRVDLVATVTSWNKLADVFSSLRRDLPQHFTIDPTQQQTIKGEKGGRFLLGANSLVDAEGNPATGPVTITLTEAYALDDMLLAGLTTTSGDRTLETGGMFQLTATDENGKPLLLADGQTMPSSIPTSDFNAEMEIFNGQFHADNEDQLDWLPTSRQVMPNSAALATREFFVDLKQWRYDGRKDFAIWKKNNPEPELTLRPVSSNRKKPEAPDTSAIRWEPTLVDGLFASKAKRARMRQVLVAKAWERYEHQQEVYAKRVRISVENKAFNERAKADFPALVAAWQVAAQGEKDRLAAINKAKNDALRAEYERRREAWVTKRRVALEASLSGDDLTGKGGDLSRYFFNVNQLGWINCDVFYGEEDPIMVEAAVQRPGEGAKVILLPEGRRAMLPYFKKSANQWVAQGIPRNEAYQIIAYQISEGQLQYAQHEVAAAKEEVEQLAFRPVSVLELKALLTGLGTAK